MKTIYGVLKFSQKRTKKWKKIFHLKFDATYFVTSNVKWEIFLKFWGLLRIYELYDKVQLFWEGHKILRNLPHGFLVFSEKLNFSSGRIVFVRLLEESRTPSIDFEIYWPLGTYMYSILWYMYDCMYYVCSLRWSCSPSTSQKL